MAEFVTLGSWLREPPAPIEPRDEPVVVVAASEEAPPPEEPNPEDELFDDVCMRVRRFGAMLDEAFEYVQQRGEPQQPLRIRVSPARVAQAHVLGLPYITDAQLEEDEAVIELRCGSIETQLCVPFRRLFAARAQ